MAQKTKVVLISDLSGDELADGDGQQITFAYKGAEYSIDLSNKEAANMQNAFAFYIDNAQRTGGRTKSSGGNISGQGRRDRQQLQAVRSWAKKNGHKVSERGRISRAVQDAFDAAHA